MNRKPIVVAGPTGVGKSELALLLAEALHGEIVNFDSIQIYRGFDIGSAKPPAAQRARVPHHLFDVADALDHFTAAAYARLAREVLRDVAARGAVPILVGGTFFYLRALLSGLPEMPEREEATRARIRRIAASPRGAARLHRWLSKIDPQSGRKIAPGDRHRVERALEVWIATGRPISSWQPPQRASEEIEALKIALKLERVVLTESLDRRVDGMYAAGLIEETRALLERFPRDARPFGAIGYREAADVISGTMTVAQAVVETKRRTRAYAKRQMTWLRAEPGIHWIDAGNPQTTLPAALRLIEG